MPPKRAQKMSLTQFLGETSWADEMEALPTAPAQRTDEDRLNDRYSRRDDFLSSRPDRSSQPPRDDLALPTQPPYTAFIGNLAFDLTEADLESFFSPLETKSIKIIKDREEKPKGFGYVEFLELEDLKIALAKSGSTFSNRTIRVSVAEPPKVGHQNEEDSKFDNPWRRDGPLETGSREFPRRRFDNVTTDRVLGPSHDAIDWRSSRPRATVPESESPRPRGSGFASSDNAADREEMWTKGSKFKPSVPEEGQVPRFGGLRRDPSVQDDGDWRSNSRPKVVGRNSTSPSSSMPSTPHLGRRKLELLPRTGATPGSPTSATPSGFASRANPFGFAKPVDVSSKEQEVADRLAKEREANKDQPGPTMSRTNSRSGSERNPGTRSPPPVRSGVPFTPSSPKLPQQSSSVRPSFSFANAASSKEVTN